MRESTDASRLELARSEKPEGISQARVCELLGANRPSVYYKPVETAEPAQTPKPGGKPKKRIVSPASIGMSMEIDIAGLDEKEAKMRVIYVAHEKLPCSGARKMARVLRACGMPATRYEAGRLMDEMDLHTICPKPNLSAPAKHAKKFPYLIRGKKIWLPNQVWAIDITYIPTRHGHLCLTAIIDWHTRLIVGWNLADTLEVKHAVACVETAIEDYGIPCVINSDMGSQFTSNEHIDLLASYDIAQSMDGKGRWIDNRIIERWFRSCKSECMRINDFQTPREVRLGIGGYIESYDDLRPHEALDYVTPRHCYESVFEAAA